MGVRKYKDVPRIYFDMDGPLADFDKEIHRHGQPGNVIKKWKGLFRDLEVVPNAKWAVTQILKLDVDPWILTKTPDGSTFAASEKQDWQKFHFPEFQDHIIITPDKGVVGTERDVLIDDHPEWANAMAFPGTIIRFVNKYEPDGSSTNNWTDIVAQLHNMFERVS
jgi:5'(3')-deoxyribonucleotidase